MGHRVELALFTSATAQRTSQNSNLDKPLEQHIFIESANTHQESNAARTCNSERSVSAAGLAFASPTGDPLFNRPDMTDSLLVQESAASSPVGITLIQTLAPTTQPTTPRFSSGGRTLKLLSLPLELDNR